MSVPSFDETRVADYLEATHAIGEHLLAAFDAACDEVGAEYFLTSGTLLGAARSGSWIPWDDDVDVIMFRDHYDRLAPRLPGLLPADIAFSSAETREDHITTIPRLFYLPSRRAHVGRTRSRTPIETRHVPLDIFVLERAPRSAAVRKPWIAAARVLEKVASARYTSVADVLGESSISAVRRLVELVVVVLSRVLTRRGWHRVRTTWVRLPARLRSSGPFVATNYSTHRGRRMTFAEDWYLPAGSIEFAGRRYPAPADAVAVLTELYGPDFLTPPDAADRAPLHLRGGLEATVGDRTWRIGVEGEAPPQPLASGVVGTSEVEPGHDLVGSGSLGSTMDDVTTPDKPEAHLTGAGFKRNVLWSLGSRVIAAVLQIAVLVLLARGLEPSVFAFVIAMNVLLQVLVAVNGFGLLRQIEFRRSRDRDDPSLASLYMTRLIFSWGSAVLWVVGVAGVWVVTRDEYVLALLPAGFWLLVEQTTQVWNSLSVVDGRSRQLVQSYVWRRLPVVVVLAITLAVGVDDVETVWAWTLALALGSVLSYAFGVRGQEQWARTLVPRRSVITERVPLELGYWWSVLGLQVRDLDVAAVSAISSTVGGIYAFPARLVAPMNLVTLAAASNAFPRVARHGMSQRQLRKGMLLGILPVSVIAALTAALAPLLPVIIGDDYADTVDVLRVTCITAVATGATSLLGVLLQALSVEDARVVGYLSLGWAFIQIAGAAVAATLGGPVVVAATVAAINSLGFLVIWRYANKAVTR